MLLGTDDGMIKGTGDWAMTGTVMTPYGTTSGAIEGPEAWMKDDNEDADGGRHDLSQNTMHTLT
jgi:hypothetical protein